MHGTSSYTLSRWSARARAQRGVALLTVLILLMVLASASVVLMQSQRWAVRQTAERLDVLDLYSASTRAHDQCVQWMREGVEGVTGSTIQGYTGQQAFLSENDARWNHHPNGCIYEWYQIPSGNDAPWTPQVRVTSRAQESGRMVLEVSEWRYPGCTTEVCQGRAVQLLNDQFILQKSLNTQYGSGTIATGRRPI